VQSLLLSNKSLYIISPFISNDTIGFVFPIPTFPFPNTVNLDVEFVCKFIAPVDFDTIFISWVALVPVAIILLYPIPTPCVLFECLKFAIGVVADPVFADMSKVKPIHNSSLSSIKNSVPVGLVVVVLIVDKVKLSLW